MFSFVQWGEKLIAFYLGKAKHIICGVNNIGRPEFCPVIDIVYPTIHSPGALLIARRMRDEGGMPAALINNDTGRDSCVVSINLSLNVNREFLYRVWPPLKQAESKIQEKNIRLVMGAFTTTYARQAEPFLDSFMDHGFFRLAIGAPHLPQKMRESLASTDLRCYRDGLPDPEYTKIIN